MKTTPPDGQVVTYDGKTYIVTPSGGVYVQDRYHWQIVPKDGPRAVAVRHQARHGHGC